jgi:hypothetical protein
MRPAILTDSLEESRLKVGILQYLAPASITKHFSVFEMASIPLVYPLFG